MSGAVPEPTQPCVACRRSFDSTSPRVTTAQPAQAGLRPLTSRYSPHSQPPAVASDRAISFGALLRNGGESEGRTHKAFACSPDFETGAVAVFRLASPRITNHFPPERSEEKAGLRRSPSDRRNTSTPTEDRTLSSGLKTQDPNQ